MPVPHNLFEDLGVKEDDFNALAKENHKLAELKKRYTEKDHDIENVEKTGLTTDDNLNRLRKERALIKEEIERIVHPPKS
ncbi:MULTISPECIES: YdcH family protein [Pseudomonas]|uniref:YdcH family protein n=1 Tax=Pseudomonas TaxID=286 RepID=UPI0007704A42|nr:MULTISPECIES: YdcH family protein [Pseudomonas]AMK32380.1 hypothetical protein AWT69_003743 [Pseudomonas putida]MDC0689337.1 YdcH family protein [Mitsuaria sp. RG]ATB66685.1 DUF465 domain-containing protein [Pseudomonas mosselii]MBC3453876.1 YdcH family protein [Pseudomonas mosselii]MCE0917482.1 YdcH family protein [Pseudomonas sp. NMI760_13]